MRLGVYPRTTTLAMACDCSAGYRRAGNPEAACVPCDGSTHPDSYGKPNSHCKTHCCLAPRWKCKPLVVELPPVEVDPPHLKEPKRKRITQ